MPKTFTIAPTRTEPSVSEPSLGRTSASPIHLVLCLAVRIDGFDGHAVAGIEVRCVALSQARAKRCRRFRMQTAVCVPVANFHRFLRQKVGEHRQWTGTSHRSNTIYNADSSFVSYGKIAPIRALQDEISN